MTHRLGAELDASPIDAKLTTRAFWQQVLERAFKTLIQTIPVFFGGGIAIANIDWQSALTACAVTVFFSVVMSIASARLYIVESFNIDLAQRAVRTFIAAFAGALTTIDNLDISDWKQAAGFAGSAVVLSLITSVGSKNLGTTGTASLLPGADLVPTVAAVVVPAATQVIEQASDQVNQAAADFEDMASHFGR